MPNNNPILNKCFTLSIFASFFCSMYPWFVWDNKLSSIIPLIAFIFAIISFFKKKLHEKKIPVVFMICVIAFSLWDKHNLNIIGQIFGITDLILLLIIIMQEREFKEKLLNFITKWFSIFLLVSLIAYILYSLNVYPILPTKIQYGTRYQSLNFGLFIIPQSIYIDYIVRFRSVFMEPGHMALGTTMLIMANHFNLKNKYVLILLIVNLFSFSLASYITMFLGYFLFNFSFKRIKYVLFALTTLLALNYALIATGNEEMLSSYIWDRLEYSEQTGSIEGDKRITAKYQTIYEETTNRIDLLVLGNDEYDTQNDYGGNAGIKRYIVEQGLVGVILLLLVYLYAPVKLRNKDAIIFSLIALLLLYQNTYPLWHCMIIPYILALEKLDNEQKILINE